MRTEYPKRRSDVNVRIVEDETIVLNSKSQRIHQLNSTASYIWNRCDGQSAVTEIADQFSTTFQIDIAVAETDARTIIEQLHELNLLEEARDSDKDNSSVGSK